MKRVRYYDRTKHEIRFGTIRDNGDIICDYCGGIIKYDETIGGITCDYEILEVWKI